MVPERLLHCLRAPNSSNAASLDRFEEGFRDSKTGAFFPDRDGVPSLLAGDEHTALDPVTKKVREFYEEYPFPNYDGVQNFGDLVRRGQSNPFAKRLLDSIGYSKLILECGCGTGQMSHFLSLNNNHVLGIDLSLSSLKLAVNHKLRNQLPRVAFIQMDIFQLGIKDDAFDVIISSGVLHHTKDARQAFACIVRKAKPGGLILIGLYNKYARVPTWLRSKLIGWLGPEIDYVVRNRIRDRRKAEIWIKDQYYNPHETWHSIDEVMLWFKENDVAYLNCYPPLLGADTSFDLFATTNPGSKVSRFLTQISWLATIASEGALFVMAGRRG